MAPFKRLDPMAPSPQWRPLLALGAGGLGTTILASLAQRPAAVGRTLETVALVALFLLSCLLIDRLLSYRLSGQRGTSIESREAGRLGRLRIGIPEGLAHLEALRFQRRLEERLRPLGLKVEWSDYASASALLQALHNGEIDFCGGGGTPSVFAQAGDLLFVRVARDKYTNPGGEAILVPFDSPIAGIPALRGCRVAVEEGSTAHYVLIRALMDAGMTADAVTVVFLSRQEALPAFRAGEVDAWSVWVPYAESPRRQDYPGRSIASLQDLFGDDPSLTLPTLYYASPEFVRFFPGILKLLLEEINEAGAQVNVENLAAVERLRSQLAVSDVWLDGLHRLANERAIVPLDSRALAGLQQQADVLRELRLIPRRVRIADGTYSLIMRQNWTR